MTFSTRTAIGWLARFVFTFCGCLGMGWGQQPPSDRMVTSEGIQLHIVTAGSGSPVVVFESGLGEDVSTWSKVEPEIAKVTSTFLYDRAGLGKSQVSSHSKDAEQISRDLHALLRDAQVPPPYVLVGHSLGGAVVQVFAGLYPREVAGLVLVDPEDGRLIEQLRARLSPEAWTEHEKAVSAALAQMPPPVQKENDAMRIGDVQTAKAVIPPVPIVLLTGTLKNPAFPGNPEEQDLKAELHHQFVTAHPRTEQVLVPQSRHYIQDDAPEKVIAAIRRVLEQAREKGKKE